MKTYNKYIALAALTLLLAACEQEDFTPTMKGDAVKINATIGNMLTRVAYGEGGVTTFNVGDKIGVKNLSRETKNLATYTLDDDKTTWEADAIMVWNGGTDINNQFQAWYPVADYSSFDEFTIPKDQSTVALLGVADWMTVSTEVMEKPENGVLNLNFQHRLAKVTVNLTFGSQYPEKSQTVSDFKFYTNEATPVAIKPLANSATSYTAILHPGEYADGTNFITLTMNDADQLTVLGKTTLPDATSKTAINLEAGKHYTFTLTVGKAAVAFSKVAVTTWTEEPIIGGVAEEVNSQQGETPEE